MTGPGRKPGGPPHLPGRAPIDAYGNGGFRFAGMSHKGSLLILPSGIHGWAIDAAVEVVADDFYPVFQEAASIDFLLFGTGKEQFMPSAALAEAFARAGMGLEPMNTGAACRTYNLLLGEARAVAAALIAVD